MQKLVLYSTLGCHLCEEAKAIIHTDSRVELEVVDIADSKALFTLYGTRIPVVKNPAKGAELAWPFDRENYLNWFNGL